VFSVYVIPILVFVILVFASIKRVNSFNSFIEGAKNAIPVAVSLLPYLVAVYMLIEVMTVSGLAKIIGDFVAPAFEWMGIPKELSMLIILKPFSGSGSMAVVNDLFAEHGVDSYIGRAASTIMASSDTLFFILAAYFARTKVKKFWLVIPISIVASIFGAVVACLIVKVL
jgi:spore maturation protein B